MMKIYVELFPSPPPPAAGSAPSRSRRAAALRDRLLLNVLHDKTLPLLPSADPTPPFHYTKPSEGPDKWGVVGIKTRAPLRGATEPPQKKRRRRSAALSVPVSPPRMFVRSGPTMVPHLTPQVQPSVQLRRPVFPPHGRDGQVHPVQNADLRPPLQQTVGERGPRGDARRGYMLTASFPLSVAALWR